MANNFNVHAIVCNEALIRLENNLVLGNLIHRDYSKDFKTQDGHEVGDTVTIDIPPRFVAVDGPDITSLKQDVSYGKRSIQLNRQKSVPFELDVRNITTEADVPKVLGEVIDSATSTLAQQIESDIAGLYTKISNFYGTPGTRFTNTSSIGAISAAMDNLAVPQNKRMGILNPDLSVNMAEHIKTLYMPDTNKSAMEKGRVGPIHSFENYKCAYLKVHTPGNWTGTILVNGANQKTTWEATKATHTMNLAIDGFGGATTVKAGDVFNIAGVFEVNPATGESTGRLRDFVVMADATAAAGAIAALSISPPIIPYDSASLKDKAQATVNTGPADNAAITVKSGATATGPHRQNLFFHKNALALVMKPLKKLESFPVWETRQKDGFTITLSKGFDINTHKETTRLDVLYGVEAIHPALAFRGTD